MDAKRLEAIRQRNAAVDYVHSGWWTGTDTQDVQSDIDALLDKIERLHKLGNLLYSLLYGQRASEPTKGEL